MEPCPAPASPFRVWGIDHLGPFPRTMAGNKYALMIVDYFSKWAVVGALPNAKAAVAVKFVREEIFHKFGIPQQIISDQGTAFTSGLWGRMM